MMSHDALELGSVWLYLCLLNSQLSSSTLSNMFPLLFWIWFDIHYLQLAYQQNRGKEVRNMIRYESLSYILIVINPFMLYIRRNFMTWSGLKQTLSCPLVRLPFPLNDTTTGIRTRRYKFLLIAHCTYPVNTKITSLLHYPEKKSGLL